MAALSRCLAAAVACLLALSARASGRRFSFPTYASAVEQMHQLAARYPHLVELTDAQSAFGLATAGTCGSEPCRNWIVHLTNRRTLPDAERPEILLLGGLHGDERIGQVSTLELVRFMAESHSRGEPWVSRLVNTTSVWLVPMTNAVGYHRNERLELGLFPNRDFGYLQRASACMTTIAGRTVNELFTRHAFQIVITFHGGMTSIGYPWGSFNHHATGPRRAPDDAALDDIARAMSTYASTGSVDKRYPFGTMNDQVYPVQGGMEDWGYAASFDARARVRCAPQSYGGYNASRQASANASMRALVFLVEAGPKRPAEATLGGDDAVLTPGGAADGHVPRNIRLSLAAIDLLRPHLELLEHAAAARLDAIVGRQLRVRYRAWGSARVDAAELVWRRTAREPWARIGGTGSATLEGAALPRAGVWAASPATNGAGEHELYALPLADGDFQIAVRARVDAHWGAGGGRRTAPAGMPPQAHLSRARTDDRWLMDSGGHRVRGQTEWLSAPIDVRVARSRSAGAPNRRSPASEPFRAMSASKASVRRRTQLTADGRAPGFRLGGAD